MPISRGLAQLAVNIIEILRSRRYKSNSLSRFGWITAVSLDLQLSDAAFGEVDVIAYLAEILCLDELSIGSGMAAEILHFHNLLNKRC